MTGIKFDFIPQRALDDARRERDALRAQVAAKPIAISWQRLHDLVRARRPIIKVPRGASFASQLVRIGACSEARAWAGRKSLRYAYRTCERGDWLLWLAARIGVGRRAIVLAACECARLVLSRVPAGENRPRIAIETAEAWCRGEATIEQVRAAYTAAYTAAANSGYTAAYTAYAANSGYTAARADTLRQCADIARKHIPLAAFEQAMKADHG